MHAVTVARQLMYMYQFNIKIQTFSTTIRKRKAKRKIFVLYLTTLNSAQKQREWKNYLPQIKPSLLNNIIYYYVCRKE